MDPCVICFEDMDMASYEDQRENTQTCVKLDCGHAYHTRCILRCLSQMDQKCPNCNKAKTPSQQLTRDGLAKKLINELKKNDEIKFLLHEYCESYDELSTTNKQLTQDVKEFIKQRKAELKLDEKRKYFMACGSHLYSTMKNYAKEKSPVYFGALQPDIRRRHCYWWGAYLDEMVLGRTKARAIYRLKFPYFRMRLY
jgi:hypothetical protein